MALPKFEKDMRIVSVLSDRPNAASNEHLDGLQLKQKFDEGGEALKEYINETLIPFLAGSEAAASLGIGTISGISEATNIQQALEALKRAIDNTTSGAIPDGSLSGAKLIANAITERELSTNSVTTGKLADNAVSGTKVADNGISGKKIADGSIANRHLGELVVENGNIADGTIDASGKLKDGSVTAKLLANDAVQEGTIKNGAVTRAKLAQDALYSPMTSWLSANKNKTIALSDLEKTFYTATSNASDEFVLTISQEASSLLPSGFGASFIFLQGKDLIIKSEGVRFALSGEAAAKDISVRVQGANDIVAITKIFNSASLGDYWLISGLVEVV